MRSPRRRNERPTGISFHSKANSPGEQAADGERLFRTLQRFLHERLREWILGTIRVGLVAALHPVACWSDALNRWAGRRVRFLPRKVWAERPIVHARRLGFQFDLDLRDNVQRELYFLGRYERRYLRFLRSQVHGGDVYIDVGAHIGIHAQLLARDLLPRGGRVFAFEPAPDVATTLRRMASVNGLTNLEVIDVALGAEDGNAELRSDPVRFDEADAAVRSIYGPGEASYSVRVVTFDQWAQRSGITRMDIVKIDVEGAELDVLRGMSTSINAFRPRLIGIEISGYLLEQAQTKESDLRTFLWNLGYVEAEPGDLEGNYVFVCRSFTPYQGGNFGIAQTNPGRRVSA